jgi:hypothetical protein
MAPEKKKSTAAKKTPAKKAPAKAGASTGKKATAARKPAARKAEPAKKAAAAKAPAAKKAPAKKSPAAPKPKPRVAPEPEPVVDEHEHDHDHDHEEVDEEQDRLDIERMGAALVALDDDALRHGLEHMSEKTRGDLATQLQLPRATMHLDEALVPLVRRKLYTVGPERQLQAAFSLTECANDDAIAALGDRSDDPSLDDLREVLPPVVAEHGTPLVTAMLAAYAASNAPVRPVMRELLDTDGQYVIGPAIAPEDAAPAIAVFKPVVDEAKREHRREAKATKRALEAQRRAAQAAGEATRRERLHKSKRKGGR